jgi:hypothetical protein
MVTLYISELSYSLKTKIAVLAILSILLGATLSITEFTIVNTVVAQMADNASMGI